MLLPLLYSILRGCWSPKSCAGVSTDVCALLTSVRFLPETLRQRAFLCPPWISHCSVDVAHSYSCSLIHANPLLLTLLPHISPNMPPPFFLSYFCPPPCFPSSLLKTHSSINGTLAAILCPCLMLAGCSQISLPTPKQWHRLYTQLFSPPSPTLCLSFSTLYQIFIRFVLCGEHITQGSKYLPSRVETFCPVLPIRLCSICLFTVHVFLFLSSSGPFIVVASVMSLRSQKELTHSSGSSQG